MSKPLHEIQQSLKTEVNSFNIHNEVYFKYQKDINCEYKKDFLITIDRDICNYDSPLGKKYQQSDTDTLLYFDSQSTQKSVIKNISEKTRNKYYNDIYVEVVSVLKWNYHNQRFEMECPGWGIKNQELGPDCLSLLFLDKNNYTNIFVEDYKLLKQKLFNEELSHFVRSEEFTVWLNKTIKNSQNKGNSSFSLSTKGKSKNNVSKVIFAKNKGYFTVGFTYDISHIKTLVNIRKYYGKINNNSLKNF